MTNSFMGLPYEGVIRDFKNEDPPEKQPQLRKRVKVKQFLLNKEEDVEEYCKVSQQVADGTSVFSYEEKIYDNDEKTWRILIRWYEQFYTAPDDEEKK